MMCGRCTAWGGRLPLGEEPQAKIILRVSREASNPGLTPPAGHGLCDGTAAAPAAGDVTAVT